MRYCPSGKIWASGGFDAKIFLYDGTDSSLVGELVDGEKNAHGGGVYGVSFSPCNGKLLSASGDKTCKIWDVETKSRVNLFEFGDDVLDQQLGCIWSKNHLVSVSLSGKLHYLDPRTPGGVTLTVEGHNKPITSVSRGRDDNKTLFTGDSDGRVVSWQTEQGVATQVKGKGPSNQINGLDAKSSTAASVVAIDDTLREVSGVDYADLSLSLGAQPRGVASLDDGTTVVVTVKSILLVANGSVKMEKPVDYEPCSVSVERASKQIAVGDGSNAGHSVHVYDANTLDEVKVVKATGIVTSVAYSPDGTLLAIGDANRRISLLSVPGYEKAHAKEWGFHSAKVTCVAWSPDSKFVASGSLDCSVILWSVESPAKHHTMASAHVQSQITGIAWMDAATVATTGQDGNVKIWNATWKP